MGSPGLLGRADARTPFPAGIGPGHRPLPARRGRLAGCTVGRATGSSPSDRPTPPRRPTAPPAIGARRAPRRGGPAAEIEGPITGGKYGIPYLAMPEGWAEEYGYTEEEFFITGDADAYAAEATLGTDGAVGRRPTDETAPYTTRIVVRRPADAADFNGTVRGRVAQRHAPGGTPTRTSASSPPSSWPRATPTSACRRSRRASGPAGSARDPGRAREALAPLKDWDPERYAPLAHPGDAVLLRHLQPGRPHRAADRATGDAARRPRRPAGHRRRRVAVGRSAWSTYVNAIQPVDRHVRRLPRSTAGATAAAPLNADDGQTPPGAAPSIRTDIGVPVLQFETETDLDFLGFLEARQDDSERLVTWEAAGTAHADRSTLDYGVAGRSPLDRRQRRPQPAACGQVNEGPQPDDRPAGASPRCDAWVVDGTPPADQPAASRPTPTAASSRDDDGIAVGGIRTPAVDAPDRRAHRREPVRRASSARCSAPPPRSPPSSSRPATRPRRLRRPASPQSAEQAVADGFLLPAAADDLIAEAEHADVP